MERYTYFAQRETLDEDEVRHSDSILESVTPRFIDDIRNFLLLRDSDNIRASNRPLAEKLPQYYRNVDGFTSIHPNRYFTPDEGPIDRDRLDELLEQHQQVADEEREAIDEELLEEFNSLWTYETLQERRVDLLLDVLDILQFDVMSDEFGLESDEDAVSEEIRRKSEEEFEKRLSARPMGRRYGRRVVCRGPGEDAVRHPLPRTHVAGRTPPPRRERPRRGRRRATLVVYGRDGVPPCGRVRR